jgi:hypothetical protein
LAYAFYDPIERLAQNSGTEVAVILGNVIAGTSEPVRIYWCCGEGSSGADIPDECCSRVFVEGAAPITMRAF